MKTSTAVQDPRSAADAQSGLDKAAHVLTPSEGIRIPLQTTSGHVIGHTVVDPADEARVTPWTWSLHSDGYAFRRTQSSARRSIVYLHRYLLEPAATQLVDHINGDRLDNTRNNLRLATPSQNCANSANRPRRSGFRGVYPHKPTGRWLAQISIDGRVRHLGIFDTAEEAAVAYDHAARDQWGAFARPNHPVLRMGLPML